MFKLNVVVKDVHKISSIACYFAIKSICNVIENSDLFLKNSDSYIMSPNNFKLECLINSKRLSDQQYITSLKEYVVDLLNMLDEADSKDERLSKVNELLETGIVPVSMSEFEQHIANKDNETISIDNIHVVTASQRLMEVFHFQGKMNYQ